MDSNGVYWESTDRSPDHRRRPRQPTPVLSPGNSHGRRSPVGRGPRGREESNTTERLPFPFSLPRIGEGRGNPLQCSRLENPMVKKTVPASERKATLAPPLPTAAGNDSRLRFAQF